MSEAQGRSERSQVARQLADLLQAQLDSNLQEEFIDALYEVVFDEQGVRPGTQSRPDVQPNLSKEFPRLYELFALGLGVHQSAKTVSKLCDEGDIDSGYILARALVERAINFAYLTVCEDTEFQAWIDYSAQKAFRLLNREKTVGTVNVEIKLHPTPKVSDIPELEALIRRFTGQRGGEVNRWSARNLDERLRYVEGKFEASRAVVGLLLTALLSVYETGAEAQHGTLFGVGLRGGAFLPPQIDDGVHQAALLTSVVECLLATITVLAHFAKRPHWAESAHREAVSHVKKMNEGIMPKLIYDPKC